MFNLKSLAAAVAAAALLLSAACSPPPKHPNQLSSFDGASYDSMTLAHAALSSLRVSVETSYPQYKPAFNEAVTAYATAFQTYSAYRLLPQNQPAAALAISNLTVSIVNLENIFQAEMHASPQAVAHVRARASRMRTAVAPRITISDIFTELEIAASVAQDVPGAQPYAMIAEVVIRATQEALAATTAATGQPIDMSTIQPVLPIE